MRGNEYERKYSIVKICNYNSYWFHQGGSIMQTELESGWKQQWGVLVRVKLSASDENRESINSPNGGQWIVILQIIK